MINEFTKQFTGTCRDFLDKHVASIKAANVHDVLYVQTTNFEKVNYIVLRDKITQHVTAAILKVNIVNGVAHVVTCNETDNPAMTHGNTKLLKMLSPTTDENAIAWRNACIATQQAVAAKRKAKRTNCQVAAQRVDDGYRPKMTRAQQIRNRCAGYRFAQECPKLLEKLIEQDAIGAIHFII